MAVEAFVSNHTDGTSRLTPVDRTGKFRVHVAKMQAITVAGDSGTTISLGKLPAGRIRVLPEGIRLQCSAFGASRVLKLGHRAYAKELGAVEAEDDDAFGAAVDVSAAAIKVGTLATLTFDMFSRTGVDLFGTVTGGTVPIGATLEVLVPYITE